MKEKIEGHQLEVVNRAARLAAKLITEDFEEAPTALGHACRVAERVYREGWGYQEVAAAYLHDTVENVWEGDPFVTLGQISEQVGPRITRLVVTLTRLPEETYKAYIERVLLNPAACAVKAADLRDNLARIDDKHRDCKPRWVDALRRIEDALTVAEKGKGQAPQ